MYFVNSITSTGIVLVYGVYCSVYSVKHFINHNIEFSLGSKNLQSETVKLMPAAMVGKLKSYSI